MITTVEQAKQKQCPESFGMGIDAGDMCIGPKCMAWEFYVPPQVPGEDHKGVPDNLKKGYCGKSHVREPKQHTKVTVENVLNLSSEGEEK